MESVAACFWKMAEERYKSLKRDTDECFADTCSFISLKRIAELYGIDEKHLSMVDGKVIYDGPFEPATLRETPVHD